MPTVRVNGSPCLSHLRNAAIKPRRRASSRQSLSHGLRGGLERHQGRGVAGRIVLDGRQNGQVGEASGRGRAAGLSAWRKLVAGGSISSSLAPMMCSPTMAAQAWPSAQAFGRPGRSRRPGPPHPAPHRRRPWSRTAWRPARPTPAAQPAARRAAYWPPASGSGAVEVVDHGRKIAQRSDTSSIVLQALLCYINRDGDRVRSGQG
jgi:hypothetical protein